MDTSTVVELGSQALWITMLVSAPLLRHMFKTALAER